MNYINLSVDEKNFSFTKNENSIINNIYFIDYTTHRNIILLIILINYFV